MVKVLKRYGREEEFIPEKIVASVTKVGAPAEIARKIAKTVEEKARSLDRIPTEEIRKVVLSTLEETNSEWATSWVLYEKAIKKRRE